MRITKATIDEMNSALIDILDDTGQQVREAAEAWLEEDADADERRDAREILDNQIPELQGQLEDLLKIIS